MRLEDILNNCEYLNIYNKRDIFVEGLSRDTRTINENEFFIAIKGENFDGNNYVLDALNKGASGVIMDAELVDEEIISFGKPIILVKDSVKFLQDMAAYKRSLYDIPVIAITGSVGKTSTKDIVASVVSQKYNCLKTEGNFNNHIGLPLTILKLKDHEALVVEMGMNHFHEIEVLSKIAKPTLAVITNVGTAHIGILGSRENILKAKLEILEGLSGKLIINNDNDLLNKWNSENSDYEVITYGINNESNIMALNSKYYEEFSEFSCMNNLVKVPVSGEHFVYNAMCAIAVGLELGISFEGIQKGIEEFSLSNNRMSLIKGDYIIIDDTYNANYDSVMSGLKYLNVLSGRKVAVLGDMLELGEYSIDLHKQIGVQLNNMDIDIIITVGELSKNINDALIDKVNYHFDNNEDAINYLNNIKKTDDKILIKASNGMRFKEIVEGIK